MPGNEANSLNLLPPLFEAGNLEEFQQAGQSVSLTLSPRSNSFATFATPLKTDANTRVAQDSAYDQDIYPASWDKPPTGERRTLITDTSVIFAACRSVFERAKDEGPDVMRSSENLATFRKLASDYVLHLQDSWVHATQLMSNPDGNPHFDGEHYRSLYVSLSLFRTLYLPEDGVEDVPVGDELLDWLNTHFIEPSTEDGDQLSSLEHPWEDELFWPYLTRATVRGLLKSSIFFLRSLSSHPSENLQRIADRLVGLLEKHPRQIQFSTEREFFTASRRWKDRAKALRLELDRVPEDDRNDGYENWWENVSDILGILEGREEILERVCVAVGGGWKEIVCTYGVWIDVGLRRSELPDVVGRTLSNVPPDPTDAEDSLHAELMQGRTKHALAIAAKIDNWLAAHVADLMVPIGLLDTEIDDITGLSIRDTYVLNYADYLHSDPGLWRLTVDYLCTCGDIGKEMADQILLRVPLGLGDLPSGRNRQEHGENLESEAEDGDLSGTVKELNATCFDYGREPTRRTICRIAARKLTKLKKYGLAVAYSRSAEDWLGLGHIIDSLMEEYILHGPLRYVQLIADVTPSLQELRTEIGPRGVFMHRMMFAVRYAEFHQRNVQGDRENAALDLISLFEEELAPRSWWGVVLYDAIPFLQSEHHKYLSMDAVRLLLRRLEEVSLAAKQGCGEDYLTILTQILKVGSVKDALSQLDTLRLALARYYAWSILITPRISGRTSVKVI
ncbi:hypothetical protein SCHPADRAFT_820586 [Schizopora paradoxa]|uniref:Nuclear pore complex protein Nup85 n=1 Tax=Schizopora paradoxa TaxID=27342 RepID=A0A0H2SLI0_9AGAM|nr:hypothetical protein SCHPADRAFT_820586 [Schizopora paradoxa]